MNTQNGQNAQDEQLTPEEFQRRLLKRRFAMKLADAEEEIATLQTQVALLQQRVQQLEAGDDKETSNTVTPELDELDIS